MLSRTILAGVLITILGLSFNNCSVPEYSSGAQPIDHAIWDSLLKAHVTEDGWVDYRGFQPDSQRLQRYLELLRSHHPNKKHWTDAQRKAYWINAYNAFTVELVLKHYPIASIKDIKGGIPFINSVWDIKFVEIEERTYDLNNIEHSILRKRWDDPRIHFALNCASYSCPVLRPEAYVADRLDQQLDDAARQFLNDTRRNILTTNHLTLSKIFSWYRMDFPNGEAFIVFLQQFTDNDINPNARVDYMDYDWRVNGLEHK